MGAYVTAVASAARTTSSNSGVLSGFGNWSKFRAQLNVSAASGTTPTLDVAVEGLLDDDVQALDVTGLFTDQMRVRWTIGGTTPSFTFDVKLYGGGGAVVSVDLGDTVRLEAGGHGADGILAGASAAVLTITLPDGTTATPTVANPPGQTGKYTADYVTQQAGRHTARWVFTSPAAAYTDVFDVREAAPPMLFSLAAAKKKLDIPSTSTGDDEELREYIEATTACVEHFVGAVVPR